MLYFRYHFFNNVLLVLQMALYFIGRVYVGVKTFGIHAVHAKYLQVACLYFLAERINDVPIFVIVKMGGTGRKKNNGCATMPKYKNLHILA